LNDSPFWIDDPPVETLVVSALIILAASSKLQRVRVEFS